LIGSVDSRSRPVASENLGDLTVAEDCGCLISPVRVVVGTSKLRDRGDRRSNETVAAKARVEFDKVRGLILVSHRAS